MRIRNRSLYALRSSVFGAYALTVLFSVIYVTPIGMALAATHFDSYDSFVRHFSYGTGLPIHGGFFVWIALFAALVIWARPILSFTTDSGNSVALEKAKVRLEGLTPALAGFMVLKLALELFSHWARFAERLDWSIFAGQYLPAMVISHLIQFVLLITVTNNYLLRRHDILGFLYTGEELYLPRKMRLIPLWIRLALLLVLNNLLPMGVIAVLLLRYAQVPNEYLFQVIVQTLLFSGILTVLGLFSIFFGFGKPITELVRKMERLAKGDFDVRTSIFFNDEVGQIKAGFNRMVQELREREQMKDLFGKFLSVEIARKLLQEGQIRLGGDRIEASVLFSDIRNFTPLSEQMSAEAVVEMLNRYFAHVVEPIMARGGVVNKFIGDAVMAVFSPVFGSVNYVEDSVYAARAMVERLQDFNASFPEYGGIKNGVGVHCGVLVAGNIGIEQRLEYTVIGDTVNTASRLESLTKNYAHPILLSEAVVARLAPDLRAAVFFVDKVQVKGKEQALEVFSIK